MKDWNLEDLNSHSIPKVAFFQIVRGLFTFFLLLQDLQNSAGNVSAKVPSKQKELEKQSVERAWQRTRVYKVARSHHGSITRNFSMTICFNFLFEDGQKKKLRFFICFPSFFFWGGDSTFSYFLGSWCIFVGIILSYFFWHLEFWSSLDSYPWHFLLAFGIFRPFCMFNNFIEPCLCIFCIFGMCSNCQIDLAFFETFVKLSLVRGCFVCFLVHFVANSNKTM